VYSYKFYLAPWDDGLGGGDTAMFAMFRNWPRHVFNNSKSGDMFCLFHNTEVNKGS